MSIVAYAVLVLIALGACAFAVWPILRREQGNARLLLAGAAALLVLGIGGGLYVIFGHPALAVRSVEGAASDDPYAKIAHWAEEARAHPEDPHLWVQLGAGYIAARDPGDAAKAFAKAIGAAEAQGQQFSFLYSAYGEALTLSTMGAVPPEAEKAFAHALTLDPKDAAARYYLGLAAVARGRPEAALVLWQGLLADVPAASPLHAELVDRIAVLRGRMGNAPDIGAMVAKLAARLKDHPDDPEGWQRLIRAYAVLGDKDKARAALGDARKTARGESLAALDAEAKELGL
jgi:cytochrome c-type biogenesis protein CcmH